MAPVILGLDVGGANVKAATADRRAVSERFALWKEPDRLAAVLAGVISRLPDPDVLAVTMTGELCDCFETKRQGVAFILDSVRRSARGREIRVWSTAGRFVPVDAAKRDYLAVASANWHALATFAGSYAPDGPAVLVDVGSTTTDVIPLSDGVPVPEGATDVRRMQFYELVYTGVRRTPVSAVLGMDVAAERFAATHDVYLALGHIPDDPADTDTADGRPATKQLALARLARMLGGDIETVPEGDLMALAGKVREAQVERIGRAVDRAVDRIEEVTGVRYGHLVKVPVIASGSGEFLAEAVARRCSKVDRFLSLSARLGPDVSACAPAHAVAVLARERPS